MFSSYSGPDPSPRITELQRGNHVLYNMGTLWSPDWQLATIKQMEHKHLRVVGESMFEDGQIILIPDDVERIRPIPLSLVMLRKLGFAFEGEPNRCFLDGKKRRMRPMEFRSLITPRPWLRRIMGLPRPTVVAFPKQLEGLDGDVWYVHQLQNAWKLYHGEPLPFYTDEPDMTTGPWAVLNDEILYPDLAPGDWVIHQGKAHLIMDNAGPTMSTRGYVLKWLSADGHEWVRQEAVTPLSWYPGAGRKEAKANQKRNPFR